ncbi:MAG: glycosyltransferase family 4 protein [Anaerolineaceae bacterium]|nr:glycosyltransferase family 4 protein [Anaerolineaceae bacterium]
MRIGHISFRLAGTDGVSLETAKLVEILKKMGHSNYYFTGELNSSETMMPSEYSAVDGNMCVPLAHFTHPQIVKITESAFGTSQSNPKFLRQIEQNAEILENDLTTFIDIFKLDIITVQNVFAIPINLPLALGLYRMIQKTNIPTINHNHDFYWEREKYSINCVGDLLEQIFPPDLSSVRQVVINSQARDQLGIKGFESSILPNIFDFDKEPPGVDEYNLDFRSDLGIRDDDIIFLQPTRVIQRKGIELTIELVSRLSDLPIKLLITHKAEFDTQNYLVQLKRLAKEKHVELLYLPERFEPSRKLLNGNQKIFSLWDAYIQADFVTYPSLYEGFGNALLETIYFKKPFLVNRYKIFQDDIEPTGIKAVKIDGEISDQAVSEVRMLLQNREIVDKYAEINTMIGKRYFSYHTAQECLERLINSFNF